MAKLMLFGKVMDRVDLAGYEIGTIWIFNASPVSIVISDIEGEVSNSVRFGSAGGCGTFATRELARDDAEAKLRRLRDTLTEVIGDG
jgi:hypothetical protein